MGEIIAVFAEMIALIVSICFQILAAVLESLGFAVGHLSSKPNKGETRFSGQRILIAFVPLLITIIFIISIFVYFDWRGDVLRSRILATHELVDEQADRLAANVDANGHFIKPPEPTLNIDDVWGNQLRVTYKETLTHHLIEVRSIGPDEEVETLDDIKSSREILRSKKEMAVEIFDKAKDAIRKRVDDRE